ncbi:hypothetical protein LOTGIDRAFT_159301 [Lottia gigantea]|uniref:PDZ domain-containing protein n=1 Tax=Lottia gigantea TaxID=225164 RepID=V4AJJ1_LOTGI|nr:hypothetical protein LOTGIDRAFT_159301 [Lottia gigantea]ESO97282.1 hypothetical protein LOTGIDRAFT_159301 [Lottia gigantea]
MERKFAKFFHSQVKELINEEDERETLFESLRKYQSQLDLESLLSDLRKLFNDPTKLELYEHIRPLILLKHQIEYSRKTPNMPGVKLRIIRLHRGHGESLGFAVRGGFEHGVGVFVSDVKPGSQADKKGLKVGDEIVRVNGFTISEAIHEDVLNLIKSRDIIMLKVTHIGMLPNKEDPNDNVSWSYVEKMDSSKALQEVLDGAGGNRNRFHGNELKIFINTAGASSIGCGILSGPNHFPGIFIEKVKPESLAEEAGLEVGDQIVEVNGTTFQHISHKEAVVTLKGSRQLDMVIRKKVGTLLFENRNQEPLKILGGGGRSTNSSHSEVEVHARNTSSRKYVVEDSTPTFNEEDLIQQHLDSRKSLSNADSNSTNYREDFLLDNQSEQSADLYTAVIPRDKRRQDNSLREELESLKQKKEVLGGKGAILAARHSSKNKPTLLGAPHPNQNTVWTDINDISQIKSMFREADIKGKDLELVKLLKNKPLGVEIEGGIGTPLADRIQVAEIYAEGCVFDNGEIQVGDQLLMVDGKSLIDLSADQARNILSDVDRRPQETVKIVIAKGFMINDEDAVTFF